jgi:hypothetical protein
MNPRPWTSTRRLFAGLRISAVSALIVLAPVLLPSGTVFAHETRSTASTTPPSRAKDLVHLEGTLEILHEDREDGSSQYHHVLSTDDGTRVSLEGVTLGQDLLTGDRVRVKGNRSEKAIRLQASGPEGLAGLEVMAAAPLSNTFGSQKTLLILVNFSNNPTQPYTVDQAKTGYAALDAWFREVSYQQTSLAIDVIGWYTLPLTTDGCDYALIQSKARQAATAAGVNLSTYVRQVYAFPFNANCQFAGMGSVGGAPSSVWINGNTNTGILAHEFGHTLGLYHSHALNCHPSVVTPPCSIVEYGDTTDTMGGGSGHYNAFQKQRIGWLDYNLSPPITTVSSGGAYTIDAYEMPGTAPKALKLARGTTGQSFFVELRRNVGWDTNLYRTGVFIHLATDNQPNSSTLLDMTPGTSPLSDDAFLDVGKSFTDTVSGVTLTTLSVSGTSATIMVDMDDTPCTRSAPSVTASPTQNPGVQPGTAVTYTVSVTNTDTAGCSAASVTLQATAPTTSWQKSFGASSVTTNPGATASTTLQITSPVVPSGSYAIAIAAASTTDSTRSGSTAVQYNVAPDAPPPPPPAGTTFTDTFDRPDSPLLDNGWAVMTGSLMIQSGESRNQLNTTFSLAVQPDLIGAAQTVEASFASTNNNSAPRFGVVVRYQNPQNYYNCYRQVGGSSVLRIAKVQNGAETVLKSVGIGNPAPNAFSKLSCQVSGTTLTLRLDGVTKLSVSNGTFTTGSVGYTISTLKGISHRAENFTATAQ